MLFDSAFLIHASGQRGRKQAAAEVFLRAHLDAPLYASRLRGSPACRVERECSEALACVYLTSPAGENRAESCFGQDSGDGFALVALNFNVAVLHGASAAACGAHFFGE